jgi:hypothetical protein
MPVTNVTRSSTLFALALSSLIATGCPPEDPPPGNDAGPGDVCETDLLYDAEHTQAVSLGEEVSGYLCPAFDEDWYAFDVDSAGSVVTVHMWMDTQLTNVEPVFRILRGDGQPTELTGRHPNLSAGEVVNYVASNRVDEAGSYILLVNDAEGLDDRLDIYNPYHFTIDVSPDPDGNEPNDDDTEATPTASGETETGLITTGDDEDWFAVTIEQDAQILDVTATAPQDMGVDLMLEAIGSDGVSLLQGVRLADDGTQLTGRVRVGVAGSPGAQYYVRLYGESGNLANLDPATGTYSVTIDVSADPDAQEAGGRNDTSETATVVSNPGTPSTFTGSLSAANDQDFFRIPPVTASPGNPSVLVVTVTADGASDDALQPQVRVLAHDPELTGSQLNTCPCAVMASPDDPLPTEPPQFCLDQGAGNGDRCGELRFQRVMQSGSTYSFGYPIRRQRAVYVSVNDFGDNDWQEGADGYTIEFQVISDPDTGEAGDDYLIPNLETASYDNSDDIRNQREQSRPRARDLGNGGALPACPFPAGAPGACDVGGLTAMATQPPADAGFIDGGPEAGPIPRDAGGPTLPACQPVVDVPMPIAGSPQCPYYVACSGQTYTFSGSGRLTYQGDRDWFTFNLPGAGYWGVDAAFTTSATTSVEPTFFMYGDGTLTGAWLEASNVQNGCADDAECPAGTNCIDNKCWEDIDNNPAQSAGVFPSEPDQCLFVHVNDSRPMYLEVVDNGINDFDPNMEYAFTLTVKCGCPASCGGGQYDSCQGVAAP